MTAHLAVAEDVAFVPASLEEAFEVVPGRADRGVLLLCDHATNIVPPEYDRLGLPEAEFERHIAYDIGCDGVTRRLAERLGAPAVLSRFSRLLIDPNRGADDPTLVMRLSDGTIVPGNHPIGPDEVRARTLRFHKPYHDAIEDVLAQMTATGMDPVVVSVHSFTSHWKGRPRPWHVGLLHDGDERAARAMIEMLRRDPDLVVGDNEPYSGALRGDTMFTHATRRGLGQALLEIRNDLIATADGEREWSDRLAPIIDEIARDPAQRERRLLPSRTGPYMSVDGTRIG